MGTALTGLEIRDTYDSLLKITDNGPLSGTAKYLSDGLGNDSVLALSTANVGIGTNSPNAYSNLTTLTINGTNGSVIDFEVGSTLFGEIFAESNSLKVDATGASGTLKLLTNSVERMRIDSAGNVGIGTSAPASYSGYTTLGINGTNGGVLDLMVGGVRRGSIYNTASGNTLAIDSPTGTKIGFLVNGAERAAVTENGITFNGDTAAANALDDYEEGTFNPAPVSVANVSNFASVTGKYTKIGNVVNFNVSFLADVASSTAESVVELTLPFGAYSISNKSVGHVALYSGSGADRFGVGSLFLGTSSNAVVNIYIAANQMNASGTGVEFRTSYTYFV